MAHCYCYCYFIVFRCVALPVNGNFSLPPKAHFDEWKTIIFRKKFSMYNGFETNNNFMNKQNPNGFLFVFYHQHHQIVKILNVHMKKVRVYETKYLTASPRPLPLTASLFVTYTNFRSCFVTGNTDLL